MPEVHTTESLFPSDLETQSITLRYHSEHHATLVCGTGFHHLLICIYCKSAHECCVARHILRCEFCQVLAP